ncbi:UNVERIFIED_CONTAM: hypothetical protein GTU68_057311 [Idotea baltica]|nr:hypothetical protein [Idotea baltica]
MSIKAADVKALRDQTGAGMMDCKKALTEANGDFEKAIEVLRKKGQKLSAKRADREAKEGVVLAKVNSDGSKGIVVRLSSETDFVAKNEDFVGFADKIAQIALAAMKPLALNKDGIDSTIVEKEIEIGKEIARKEGKPEEMLERIAMGKLNKFFRENTLLDQSYVKDSKQSVSAYLDSVESGLTVIDFKHVKLG